MKSKLITPLLLLLLLTTTLAFLVTFTFATNTIATTTTSNTSITTTTTDGLSSFKFIDFSPVTELLTFEISLNPNVFQARNGNVFSFRGQFTGIEPLLDEIYGYGQSEFDDGPVYTSSTLQRNITIDEIGHLVFFFDKVSFPSPHFVGNLVSLKFFGSFKAKIIDQRNILSFGQIQNLINIDVKTQWEPTAPIFNRPFAQSFDFISTSKIDTFGREYKSFRLIINGINQDLIVGRGIRLGSFALIEATPRKDGEIGVGRFGILDPQSGPGCRLEENDSQVNVNLSPWNESTNILSIENYFFQVHPSDKWTLSCDNLGYYSPKKQSNFISSSSSPSSFSSPSSSSITSTQSRDFQRLTQQLGLNNNNNQVNNNQVNNSTSSTTLRLLAITQDNQRYIVDKWN